jgi:hypothetical protein
VEPDVPLSWLLGTDNTRGYYIGYGIHYGTNETTVANEPNTAPAVELWDENGWPTQTAYDLAGLPKSTDIFWRVDTIVKKDIPPFNEIVIDGDVWTFMSASDRVGTILREWWLGIGNGTAITDLTGNANYPNNPSGSELRGLFEGPTNWADNYGSRIHGWLIVQKTGDYTFLIATDDNGELWLSTDEDPANAVLISTCGSAGAGWAPARGFDDGDVTASAPIYLEGGKGYYISGLMKEGGGGDNIAVAWSGPDSGDVREVIPGDHLVPYLLIASNPSPADGAADVPLGTMLSWTPGIDPATFDGYTNQRVYIGTDAARVATAGVGSPEDKGAPTGPDEYGPLSLSYYQRYYWRIDGTDSDGTLWQGPVWTFKAIYNPANVVDPNLKAWYKFDGDATDSSGYGRDGAEMNGPTYGGGYDGEAISIDGVDDYVSTGMTASNLGINGGNAKTTCAWVYTRAFNDGGIWEVGEHANGRDWSLRTMATTNTWRAQRYGYPTYDFDGTYPSLNEWVHFALVYDGTGAGNESRLYADADVIGTQTAALNTADSPKTFAVGRWNTSYFNGLVDDLRVYNRALTQAEIAKLVRFSLASAWGPNPLKGAIDVSLTPILTWKPGDYAPPANGHKVYFGADDPANMALVTVPPQPQTPTSYTPGALDLGTTYYWAVNEVNAAAPGGVDAGETWSFTTTNKVVDDFETYEDENTLPAPLPEDVNWIYFVYTDGFGDLACTEGSGNDSGAKISLRRPGQPSSSIAMKFEYDNDGMVKTPSGCDSSETPVEKDHYSKAEALVAKLPSGIGPNWTAAGAKILSVSFYGDPNNVIDPVWPMWVQLTDSSNRKAKVLYGKYADEDINDVKEASWHEWLIDLEDFNAPPTRVKLTDVNSIAIGVGDDQATSGVATGTLYFDDIGLYGPRCVLTRRGDFAALDYAPEGVVSGDCKIDYKELALMSRDWLAENLDETALWTGAWTSSDVGDVNNRTGSFTDLGSGSFTIVGDGADIWGTADGFRYAYKRLTGDGQITVRVTDLTHTNDWAKAGVMIRETLDANSVHAMIIGTPGTPNTNNRISAQGRATKGADSFNVDVVGPTPPYCLRLVRRDDTFTGYYYSDGKWVQVSSATIPMTDPVYIGMVVTSHTNGALCTAHIDRACSTDFIPADLVPDDIVNFKDYSELALNWLDQTEWPLP